MLWGKFPTVVERVGSQYETRYGVMRMNRRCEEIFIFPSCSIN